MNIEYENTWRRSDTIVLLPVIGVGRHPVSVCFIWLVWSVTVEFE